METINTIDDVRQAIEQARLKGLRIGFVPTMGDLHAGHVSLIAEARRTSDFVVVSVFVNPTQFGPGEDYEKYSRNLPRDAETCRSCGVDVLFAPSVEEMYPHENLTWVNVERLAEPMCGRSRQDHFRGVATVCTKLFNIIRPDIAYFGRKDAQQAIIIKRMVKDLNMPLRIVVCPTVREPDGLAMSSRNRYLSPTHRQDAVIIYRALTECGSALASGERDAAYLNEIIARRIAETPSARLEYICIMDAATLLPVDRITGKTLIAVAVRIGSTRLIDNLMFDPAREHAL